MCFPATTSCLISPDQQSRNTQSIEWQLKMSYEVCGDPRWSVRYSEGHKEERGEREERLVNIYDSVDPVVGGRAGPPTRDRGVQGSRGWGVAVGGTQQDMCSESSPSAAARSQEPYRAAALVLGVLGALLLVGLTVLTGLCEDPDFTVTLGLE